MGVLTVVFFLASTFATYKLNMLWYMAKTAGWYYKVIFLGGALIFAITFLTILFLLFHAYDREDKEEQWKKKLQKATRKILQDKQTIRTMCVWFCYVLLFCFLWILGEAAALHIVVFLMYVHIPYVIFGKREANHIFKQPRIRNIILLFCSSYLAFFMLQFLMQGHFYNSATNDWVIFNWGLMMLLSVFFVLIFNSFQIGMLVTGGLSLVWGLVNHLVLTYKGQPLQLSDITSAATALNVVSGYRIELTEYYQRILIVIAISYCIIILTSQKGRVSATIRGKIVVRLVGVAMFVAVSLGVYFIPWEQNRNMTVNYWNLEETYKDYGVPAATIYIAKQGEVSRPQGYSIQEVERLAQEYSVDAFEDIITPNIIVIMNESFSDLTLIKELTPSEPVTPFIDDLKENALKGNVLVSTMGGGTAKTEFEFLTGHSMMLFSQNRVSYMSDFYRHQYSLVSTLKEQGYHAVAMHPETGRNWNRLTVYHNMGFDEFYDIEHFQDSELIRDFVSDQSNYEKIVEQMNQVKDKPLFLFNVTMQNHGGYDFDNMQNRISVEEYNHTEVEQFLTLMNESDKALQYLLEALQDYVEPTVVLMFGDHFPSISSDVYEWLVGKERADWTLEDIQKQHMVPYILWSNYDIDDFEAKELLGVNYLSSYLLNALNINMTPYNHFLLELKEHIPAMNVYGYMDVQGDWHKYEVEEPSMLMEYRWLQYNGLLDVRNRVDAMFQID